MMVRLQTSGAMPFCPANVRRCAALNILSLWVLSCAYAWAGCGTFEPYPLSATATQRGYAVTLADFNQDGAQDAFIGMDGPDRVYFIVTNGFCPIVTDSGQRLGTGITFGAVSGDLDGDDDLDVFATGEDGGRIWYNDGSGIFTGSVLIVTNAYCTGAAIGDLNGDTNNDLVVCRGSTVAGFINLVLTNDGTGAFTILNQPSFILDNSRAVALGDMDNDGNLDAYVANNGVNRRYKNNGAGVFGLWGSEARNDDSWSTAIADVNGDGCQDVIVGNAWPGPSILYLNSTNDILSEYALDPAVNDALGVAVADFSGDLKPDLFLVGWGDDAILLNVDGTNFSRSVQPLWGSWNQAAAAGDLNGDGVPDVITVNFWGTNTIWLNECVVDKVKLWIYSPYGPAGPVNQTLTNPVNTVVTNTIASPVDNDQTQYLCSGWALFGNQPFGGADTNCIFTQTNNALLIWAWSTNFWLTAAAGDHGWAFPTSGWYAAGLPTVVTAMPDAYYHFDHWTGSMDSGSSGSNPLTIWMNGPQSIVAFFDANLATNYTPEWWLASYGWTNDFDAAALADQDGDWVAAWKEYRGDTIPTNADSCLRLLNIDSSVHWAGGTVATQYLEVSTSLGESASWTTLLTNAPPTPITNEWPVSVSDGKVFFRLRAIR